MTLLKPKDATIRLDRRARRLTAEIEHPAWTRRSSHSNTPLAQDCTSVFFDVTPEAIELRADLLGCHPVYIAESPEAVVVSSCLRVSRSGALDMAAARCFVHDEDPPNLGATPWRGVRLVPPGAIVRLDSRSGRLVVGPSPESAALESLRPTSPRCGAPRFLEILAETLEKTLKGRAAVHLGLSGGLDSSALLAILCSMEVDVVVWMLDDGAEADEEQRHAENLVTRFGVESRVVTVDPTSLPQRFEETVRLAQGPVINGRALSKLLLFREVARGGADHFVSGTGADEVLLGTPSEAGGDRLRRLRGETRRLLFPIESRLPAALGLLPIMPFLEAPSLATALLLTTRELIGPRGEGKSILRQAMKGLLPDEVRLQPKQPVWHPAGGGSPETRQRWTALLRQWLVDRPTPARSLVDPATLSSLLKEHGALETTPARLALIEPTLLRLASLAILSHAREEERAP